jgi:hypothetical protein
MEVQWILGGHPLTVVGYHPSPHLTTIPQAEDADLRRQLADLAGRPPTDEYPPQLREEEAQPAVATEHRISMVQTGPSSWRIFADRR